MSNTNQDNEQNNKNSDYKIEILKGDETYENEINFKIILIGDSFVGKTSLSYMITKEQFKTDASATVAFDIFDYKAKINDKIFNLKIWDTCGSEQFSSTTTSLYKNSSLAIIVYSIDNDKSFRNVSQWTNLLKSNSNPDIIIFLVGNKCDLEDKRMVSKEEGQKFKEENNFGFFKETSAKDNLFVKDLFREAIIQLYEQHKRYQSNEEEKKINFEKKGDNIEISGNNIKKRKKRFC